MCYPPHRHVYPLAPWIHIGASTPWRDHIDCCAFSYLVYSLHAKSFHVQQTPNLLPFHWQPWSTFSGSVCSFSQRHVLPHHTCFVDSIDVLCTMESTSHATSMDTLTNSLSLASGISFTFYSSLSLPKAIMHQTPHRWIHPLAPQIPICASKLGCAYIDRCALLCLLLLRVFLTWHIDPSMCNVLLLHHPYLCNTDLLHMVACTTSIKDTSCLIIHSWFIPSMSYLPWHYIPSYISNSANELIVISPCRHCPVFINLNAMVIVKVKLHVPDTLELKNPNFNLWASVVC